MLIDTHAHLDLPDFDADLPEVIARARDAGVTEMIAMAMSVETSEGAIRVAEKFPNVWACVGIHPMEVGNQADDAVDRIRELARHPRVVGIGEIGLDYHAPDPDAAVEKARRERQARFFRQQLELAAEMGFNVNLHVREAYDPTTWSDALDILAPFAGKLRGCFHCFKATPEQVAQAAELGHIVSFTGFVTYPEMAQIPKTAAVIPSGTFMLETDCPYQHPPPDVDKRCEPAHVRDVAEKIAQVRGITVEQLAAETMATAHAFYRFPAP